MWPVMPGEGIKMWLGAEEARYAGEEVYVV
jgi:hypothetical protein